MSGCKTVIKKVKDTAEATALVMDWFERENKPSTPQSLTDALGSRVSKALIQKLLEQLHADNKLSVTELKKIRFYYLNQSSDAATASMLPPDPDAQTTGSPTDAEGTDNAAAAAVDVAALGDVSQAAAALAEHHRTLARWRGWPSRADRAAQRAALEVDVQRLQSDVAALQKGLQAEDEGASRLSRVRRAVRRYRRARQLWTERKRCAMRLLEATGGDMHSPQQMAALLGCTTDADVGVSFDSTAVALPPQLLRDIGLT